MKIFKVRHVPPELEEEERQKTVHLVDVEDKTRRPIFKNDEVEVTKEKGSPWWTVKVK